MTNFSVATFHFSSHSVDYYLRVYYFTKKYALILAPGHYHVCAPRENSFLRAKCSAHCLNRNTVLFTLTENLHDKKMLVSVHGYSFIIYLVVFSVPM